MNHLATLPVADARLPRSYEAAKTARSLVYMIQNAATGSVKIGVSTDLAARLKSLSTGCDGQLHVIRTIPAGEKVERWLHRRFAAQRLRGEWFAFHPDMMTVIPPDEAPTIARMEVRRDVRLTAKEQVKSAIADGEHIGATQNEILMMISSRLTREQAAEVLKILEMTL